MCAVCSRCSAQFDAADGEAVCPECRAVGPDPAGPGTPSGRASTVPTAADGLSAVPGAAQAGGADAGRKAPAIREFGRYEILEEISRGAMGIVYLAREKLLKRVVALKVLLAGEHASEEQIGRFIREARAIARLRHPNIVPIHDVGEVDGRHYFTMDYIEGEPLSRASATGKIGPRQALDVIECVADAVQCAHEAGVIHRDIKPSNIMIDRHGRVQIMDFGLAKPDDGGGTKYTRTGTTLGTPAYMPPEQARGDLGRVSPRSDVYSIGAVFYELVTGEPPFDGPNTLDIILDVIHGEPVPPRRRAGSIHADIQTIILHAMEKEPERRYASAADLRDDIRRFKAGEAILARPPGRLRLIGRALSRHRVAIFVTAFTVAVVAGAVLAVSEIQRRLVARAGLPAAIVRPGEPAVERPVWRKVWEPDPAGQDEWRERDCLLGGRERYPNVPAPFLGSVKITATVRVPPGAEDAVIVLGLASTQDPEVTVPFYGVVGGGSMRIHALPDIESTAVSSRVETDLAPLIERAAPPLVPGGEYRMLFERRDMDIDFTVAGPGLTETLTVRDLHFSNWRAKNLLPVAVRNDRLEWESFRVDQLMAGKMDAFETADGYLFLGEYNGAREMYRTIVENGKPPGRVNAARLRLGMVCEIEREYEDAIAHYRSVAAAPARDEADQLPGAAEQTSLRGMSIPVAARLREVFCLAALNRADEAEQALLDLADKAGRMPQWNVSSSPWVWGLASLAEGFLKAGRLPAAVTTVALAAPPAGWRRMEEIAVSTADGLAAVGDAEELRTLAEACPSAGLAPAFARAIAAVTLRDGEAALDLLAYAVERFPGAQGDFAGPAAALARRWIAEGAFAGVTGVHRLCAAPEVSAVLPEAVSAAVEGKAYAQAVAILAYAHSWNPKHDDQLRRLAAELADAFCAEGRFTEVRSVFEAYPDRALVAGFRRAAMGLADAGDLDPAIRFLEYARRNLGTGDEGLAEAAASISRRLVASGSADGAGRVREPVEAYPGSAHAPYVRTGMDILAKAGRPREALALYTALRVRLPEGDEGLAHCALGLLEGIEDPVKREQAFDVLADASADFGSDARAWAGWLVELGDVATRIGGRAGRAEGYYLAAASRVWPSDAGLAAAARLGTLLDASGRREPAERIWRRVIESAPAAGGVALAARVVLGEEQPESLANWQAGHPAEMSSADVAVFLGLRALRAGRRTDAAAAFARAQKMVGGKGWPYPVLDRLLTP